MALVNELLDVVIVIAIAVVVIVAFCIYLYLMVLRRSLEGNEGGRDTLEGETEYGRYDLP